MQLDVFSLHSNDRQVSSNYVTIVRVVKTIMQIQLSYVEINSQFKKII